ncbi:MAG: hypothetical protein JWP58_3281 [Hymenobacter sp.]|nr:hypothetical protein [Hymenobacter sp.]
MPLTRYKLVNTEGLKGLFYKGDTIPFDKIDDTLADELVGKTHVLERIAPATTAPDVVPTLPAAEAEAESAEEVAPATSGRRARSN